MANKAVRNVAPIKGPKKEKTSVIILAASEGSRMKSYGPRSLLPVTNKLTLIGHQINVINQAIPLNEIILVCGFEADRLMNHTPKTVIKIHHENYENTNIVRGIGLGLRAATTDRVLLIYGDLVFNDNTLLNAQYNESSLFIDELGLFAKHNVGCTFNEDSVAEQLLYELPKKWVQIAFLMGKELSTFRQMVWNREHDNWFTFEALNGVIDKGGQLKYQSPKDMRIIDIDSSKDLYMIKEVLCE